MAQVRVQARFTHAPVLDANFAMNTFHFFDGVTAYEAHRDDAVAAVREFYETVTSAPRLAVGAYFAATIARAYQIRAYDMSTAPPRTPTIYEVTLPAANYSTTRIPYEISMALSYQAAPPVSGRRRGRIYLPGVQEGWLVSGTSLVPPRWSELAGNAMDAVAQAASRLAADSAAWSIRSSVSVPAQYHRIESGYIDWDPDIQRRRGFETVDRTEWS